MYFFSSKIKENPCSPLTIELKSHLTTEYGIFIHVFKKYFFHEFINEKILLFEKQ